MRQRMTLADVVDRISDRRIRYERSDEFLPVTDSWNRAIDLASGSYVTLLGDDDGLTPGYFEKLSKIIDEFGSPDVLYSAIYQFLHPGVAPWERRGYVADIKNAFFFVGRQLPFLLSKRSSEGGARVDKVAPELYVQHAGILFSQRLFAKSPQGWSGFPLSISGLLPGQHSVCRKPGQSWSFRRQWRSPVFPKRLTATHCLMNLKTRVPKF